jgi:hypothetical protein
MLLGPKATSTERLTKALEVALGQVTGDDEKALVRWCLVQGPPPPEGSLNDDQKVAVADAVTAGLNAGYGLTYAGLVPIGTRSRRDSLLNGRAARAA